MKQVYVILADGFEEIEAITPIDYLRRAQTQVTTISLKEKFVKGSHGIVIQADSIFDDSLPLPDAIVIPGGMPGAKNIGDNKNILAFIQKCFEQNKIVAAICASPVVVLSKTTLLQNKSYTCYPGMQNEFSSYCPDEQNIKNSSYKEDTPFVTDGTLVTGRGPGAAEQFSMQIVKLLCGDEVAKQVHSASVQR